MERTFDARGFATLVSFIFFIVFSCPGLACTCFPPPSQNVRDLAGQYVKRLGKSGIVFDGVVVSQKLDETPIMMPSDRGTALPFLGEHRVVRLRSVRTYRGTKLDYYTVVTGLGNGDCGFDFVTGREYLVFAVSFKKAYRAFGSYFTDSCRGTDLVERSAPALRLLRGEPPLPEDLLDVGTYHEKNDPAWSGTVCGRIAAPGGQKSSVEAISVYVWQLRSDQIPPIPIRTALDADGRFCIPRLLPGEYILEAEEPALDASEVRFIGYYPGVFVRSEAVPIVVQAGAKAEEPEFSLQEEPLYKVSIRVAAAERSVLPLAYVRVALDGPDSDPVSYHVAHNGAGEDGIELFSYVPAGHYIVTGGVRTQKGPTVQFEFDPRWQPAKQEIDVNGDTEVTLKFILKE
jgi:hypothetical protein